MDGYLLDLQHLDPFQKWTLICAGGLTLLYIAMRPFKKRNKDPLARATSAGLAGQREVERQMTDLLVELEQMARQMTAQLDTRAGKLELLIKEADEKIALLQGPGRASLAEPMAILPTDTAPGMPAVSAADPRHVEVYDLADSGQSARQIAQQLGRPYGEIELILALRQRTATAASA